MKLLLTAVLALVCVTARADVTVTLQGNICRVSDGNASLYYVASTIWNIPYCDAEMAIEAYKKLQVLKEQPTKNKNICTFYAPAHEREECNDTIHD